MKQYDSKIQNEAKGHSRGSLENCTNSVSETVEIPSLEKIAEAMKGLNDFSGLTRQIAKAHMRKRYFEYLTTCCKSQSSLIVCDPGLIGQPWGFPIIIDEQLPFPLMARFYNSEGKSVGEIKLTVPEN